MEKRNSKWNATFFGNSIYSIYSTPKSGIDGRAGIAGIVVIDLNELQTFILE